MAVARILMSASTHLPTSIYAAAMLHDVMEDADYSYAEIAARVGRSAATMVLGLTRPERTQRESRTAREERYIAQMRIVQPFEPGIVLIKIADRLHNLQTASALPVAKQRVLISQTEEIYLPFFESARKTLPIELRSACAILLQQLQSTLDHAKNPVRGINEILKYA
jgi:(p)ppGpp synthase/HD superfamily hydrolase